MLRKPGEKTPEVVNEEPKEPEYVPVVESDSELPEAPEFSPEDINKSLTLQESIPEAICSLSTKLYGKRGGEVMVTIRSSHPQEAFKSLATAIQFGAAVGLQPHPFPGKMPSGGSSQSPSGRQEAEPQGQSIDGVHVLQTGTDVLHKIVVNPEGAIEFTVGKFNYPFRDTRGAETVARLFDPSIGMTVEHLNTPAKYTPADWNNGTLLVNWHQIQKENGKKYYNVLQVLPG